MNTLDSSMNELDSRVVEYKSALDAKAPIVSPALTGVPTAPTASAETSTDQIATTAFVTNAVSSKLDSNATKIGPDAVNGQDSAGKTLTIHAGQGTGTGAGGSIIFQVADGGGSSSNVNNLNTALKIADDMTATFGGDITVEGTLTASSITLTTEIKSDATLSSSQTSVINGSSLTITIDAASANQPGTVITLLTGANNYTLSNGNSKTATIQANSSTIIITTGINAGDIVAYSNGTLVTFNNSP